MVEVAQGTTVLAKYRYDGLGRLFEAAHPGRATDRFVWCGEKLCARYRNGVYLVEDALQTRYLDEGEYHPSGVQTMSYPSGIGGFDALVPVGKKLVATRNHLGNVTGFIDADRRSYLGDVSYTPYGEIVAGAQVSEKPYGGLYYDRVTQLYLSNTRAYDPSIGRWLSRDPIGENGGVNLYAYASGDPLNWKDPMGTDIWIEESSGDDPYGHQSVNIGDPFGEYESFSYGADFRGGSVYQEDKKDQGGEISAYFPTSPDEDGEARWTIIDDAKREDDHKWYAPWNTCRNYSQDKFEKLRKKFGGTRTSPPARVAKGHAPFRIGANISTTTSSTTTTTSAAIP